MNVIKNEISWKFICILLLILSIADAIFTDYGLRNGYIDEFNKWVLFLYTNSLFVYYIIKIMLPFLLIILIPYVYKNKLIKIMFSTSLFLYTSVFIYHLGWIGYIFLFNV